MQISADRRSTLSNFVTVAPYRLGLGYEEFPQLLAARARVSRSCPTACCSSAARSAGPINAWVGRRHAVGHRVTPFDRMNSAIASQSSSDILSPSAADSPSWRLLFRLRHAQIGPCVTNVLVTSIAKMVNLTPPRSMSRDLATKPSER